MKRIIHYLGPRGKNPKNSSQRPIH